MHYLKKYSLHLLIAACFTYTNGRVEAQSAASTHTSALYLQSSEVHHLLVQYEADKGSLTRFYFVKNSPERRERFKNLQTEYIQKLQQLNFDNFNTSSKIDYILFERDLKEELRNLDIEEKELPRLAPGYPCR